MSKPFDATSKDLIESAPADWVTYLGQPTPPDKMSVIDADLSAVTAAADKVIRVVDGDPWVLHLEFQASTETGFPRRLLRYNAPLQERYACPVTSVVFLLRKEANSTDLTGEWTVTPSVGPGWAFRYQVVRVWQLPVEPLLTGGLSLLPLAPLAAVYRADLPHVFDRMKARLDHDAPREVQRRMGAAAGLLMGLRFDEAFSAALLQGVLQIEESSVYQMILRRGRTEGQADEARRMIVLIGEEHLGAVPPEVQAALDAIPDVARLEALAKRLKTVATWQDLLAGP